MNAISIPVGAKAGFSNATPGLKIACNRRATSAPPPAEWLPAAADSPRNGVARLHDFQATAQRIPTWIVPAEDAAGEKCLWSFLALASAIAIAYGFSCLVDLVQHWALFNAGVEQLTRG